VMASNDELLDARYLIRSLRRYCGRRIGAVNRELRERGSLDAYSRGAFCAYKDEIGDLRDFLDRYEARISRSSETV